MTRVGRGTVPNVARRRGYGRLSSTRSIENPPSRAQTPVSPQLITPNVEYAGLSPPRRSNKTARTWSPAPRRTCAEFAKQISSHTFVTRASRESALAPRYVTSRADAPREPGALPNDSNVGRRREIARTSASALGPLEWAS